MKVLARVVVLCGLACAPACGGAEVTAPAPADAAPAVGRSPGGAAHPDSVQALSGGDGGVVGMGSGG